MQPTDCRSCERNWGIRRNSSLRSLGYPVKLFQNRKVGRQAPIWATSSS